MNEFMPRVIRLIENGGSAPQQRTCYYFNNGGCKKGKTCFVFLCFSLVSPSLQITATMLTSLIQMSRRHRRGNHWHSQSKHQRLRPPRPPLITTACELRSHTHCTAPPRPVFRQFIPSRRPPLHSHPLAIKHLLNRGESATTTTKENASKVDKLSIIFFFSTRTSNISSIDNCDYLHELDPNVPVPPPRRAGLPRRLD